MYIKMKSHILTKHRSEGNFVCPMKAFILGDSLTKVWFNLGKVSFTMYTTSLCIKIHSITNKPNTGRYSRPVQRFQCSLPTFSRSFTPSSIALVKRLNCSHFCSLNIQKTKVSICLQRHGDLDAGRRTYTSTRSRSGTAWGSMVEKIITPTVSSFSARLLPVFQSWKQTFAESYIILLDI